MQTFKLKATITVHIDAVDAFDLRTRRAKLEEVTAQLRSEFTDACCEVRGRRQRTGANRPAPSQKLGDEYEIVRVRLAG